ncbi:hypothetical protein GCM10008983_16120 [Lentibacillus halophilus]|uniref:Uncharacterized protein n=1 Tax=Lentibacillus halophilus TaxID=295065 RepID=A0ABP3J394_9BACI
MVQFVSRGLRLSIFLYALLHFINYFFNIESIAYIHAVIGFVMLILSAVNLTLNRFKLPLFLITAGVITLVVTGGLSAEHIKNGLLQMSDIIGLLAIVPLIGWVLRQEAYINEMIGLAHKLLDSSRKFYFVMISFTHILSYFLLFGVISLMYQFVSNILQHQRGEAWEYFKGTALLRGFALSTIWTISIPSFAFAVEALNASLWQSILQGFFVAVAGIVMAVLFSRFEEKSYGIDFTSEIKKEISSVLEQSSDKKDQLRTTGEFIFLFITLFGSIFLLYEILAVKLMLLIPFVIIVWSVIYFLVKRKMKHMVAEMKNYYANGLSSQAYQFSVLISAGIVILAVNQSGIGKAVVNRIYSLQEVLPFFNMLYFLPFIVIILGFIGLGPLTVMVLVAGILESISLPYPPELIVLAVTSGSAISILVSPLIMPVIILSGTNGLSPFKNGLAFNYKFAIAFYILVQCYIQWMVS